MKCRKRKVTIKQENDSTLATEDGNENGSQASCHCLEQWHKNYKNIFSGKNVRPEAYILKAKTRISVEMLNHDRVIIQRHHRLRVTW